MLRSLQDGAGNLTIRRTMKLQTIGSAWNDGGQKKEETDKEYKERVMAGDIDGEA